MYEYFIQTCLNKIYSVYKAGREMGALVSNAILLQYIREGLDINPFNFLSQSPNKDVCYESWNVSVC